MAQHLFRLDGKIAFVSGARGHLGRAMVQALGAAGAHVIVNGRDDVALARHEAELREQKLSVSRAAFDVSDMGAYDVSPDGSLLLAMVEDKAFNPFISVVDLRSLKEVSRIAIKGLSKNRDIICDVNFCNIV